MSSPWKVALVLFCGLLTVTGRSPAQDDPPTAAGSSCETGESFAVCFDRLLQRAEVRASERADEETKVTVESTRDEVEEKATPSSNPGASSSILDFLPSLVGALGFTGVSDTDGDFNFDKNWKLGDFGKLKLGGTVFADAELFQALRDKLPQELRDTRASELEAEIGDFDKVDYGLSLTREGHLMDRIVGRNPADYTRFIENWAFEVLSGNQPSFAAWRAREEVQTAVEDYNRLARLQSPSFFNDPLEDLEDVLGDKRVESFQQDIARMVDEYVAFVETVDLRDQLDQLDRLIANQPQFILEGSYRERRDLTGPDEWQGSARYEIGLSGNFNDFLSWAAKDENRRGGCALTTDGRPSLDCLNEYLGDPAFSILTPVTEEQKAERAPRLAVNLKYSDTGPVHFGLPADDFVFDLSRSQVWTGSLTYGRYLPNLRLPRLPSIAELEDVDLDQITRFDLEAKYDDATGDPLRQSRFVATATLSQKTSGNALVSISAVYANRPEYLGEVNEELSANLGIKWQVDEDEDE